MIDNFNYGKEELLGRLKYGKGAQLTQAIDTHGTLFFEEIAHFKMTLKGAKEETFFQLASKHVPSSNANYGMPSPTGEQQPEDDYQRRNSDISIENKEQEWIRRKKRTRAEMGGEESNFVPA